MIVVHMPVRSITSIHQWVNTEKPLPKKHSVKGKILFGTRLVPVVLSFQAAFGSVPAYLFSWMSIMLLKPAACSIVALTCAEYIMVPAFNDGCGPAPPIYTKVVAASVVCETIV